MTANGRSASRELEHKRRSAQRRARRRLTLIWMAIITLFCIIVMIIIHLSPVIIKKFTIVDEYLPQDIERKYFELQDKRSQQPGK